MQDGDGDAVGDVESSTADAEGFNAPFANRCCFPSHLVKQELCCDVANVSGVHVHLKPGQFVGRNPVVIRVKQFGTEVDGIVRRHFYDGAG